MRDDSGIQGHSGGIGVLGEKSLHAVLKLYYEPDPSRHEVPVGDYVADIAGEDGITEIQTRGLARLKPKLAGLLEIARVTVVHPVIASRRIVNLDGDTGEVLSSRMSPKHGTLFSAMREIYSLRDFLPREGLTLRLPLLTAEEFRRFGVRTNRRKKQRRNGKEYLSDVIPSELLGEWIFCEPEDYAALIPEGLPRPFHAGDFAAAARTNEASARMAIQLLARMGLARDAGKSGRRRIWRV